MIEPAPVRLEVATAWPNARVVRSMVASCVAIEGGSIDRIEDVRLLADELFNALVVAGADRVTFDIDHCEGQVRLRAMAGVAAATAAAFEMVTLVAGVVAPGYALTLDVGHASFDGVVDVRST